MHYLELKLNLTVLVLVLLLGSPVCYSQNYLIGVETGIISDPGFESSGYSISGVLDRRFSESRFSIVAEPGIIFLNPEGVIGSFPLHIRYGFGEQWKFYPSLGFFYWTSRRWGGSAGLDVERSFNEKWVPFLSFRYLRVLYRNQNESQIGNVPALNFAAGIKYRIK